MAWTSPIQHRPERSRETAACSDARRAAPRTTTRPRSTPWSAVALALVCLVAQAASYLHLAVVRHVQCPEHGELVHLGPSTAAGPEVALETVGDTDAHHLRGAAASPSWTHDEGHCLVGFSQRSRAGLGQAPSRLAPPTATRPLPPDEASAPRIAAVALYRLAPKASPPV